MLASGSLQPVQESGSGVDILLSTGSYKAYITIINILSGSGNIFIPLLTNFDSTISTYPGCDTKDIKLPNGQIWAACNVGATSTSDWNTASTDRTQARDGYFFQFGRDDPFPVFGTVTTTGILSTITTSTFSSAPTTTFIVNSIGDWRSNPLSVITNTGGNIWPTSICQA